MLNWFKKRRANALLKQAEQTRTTKQDPVYAARLASAAVLLQPKLASAYQQRALCYHAAGDDNAALQDLQQALALSANDGQLYWQRAELHADMGNHAAALKDFDAAERLLGQDAGLYQMRAGSYLALDRIPEAIADLGRAITLSPTMPALYRRRGELLAINGQTAAALQDYDHAMQLLQPRVPEAQRLLEQLGDEAENPNVQHLMGLLLGEYGTLCVQRGQLRLGQGDLPGALDDFNAALQHLPPEAPQLAQAFSGRGRVRALQHDTDALADFQAAIDHDPSRAATYFNLAEFYFQLNQFGQAHTAFKQLASHDPTNPLAEMGLALCEHALRHKTEARQRWKKLMAQDARFGDLNWLETAIFPNHPHLMKAAGNLVLRVL